jgi:hypothetical protein
MGTGMIAVGMVVLLAMTAQGAAHGVEDKPISAPAAAPAQDAAASLREHVETLAGRIGERNVFRPQALAAAAAYIRSEWERQGYRIAAQSYVTHGVVSENLEVTLPGAARAGEIILVGAHYDSVRGSPGANDNGSGVAALLELGHRLKHARLARTVRLVAFVNEEPPFFYWGEMGSGVYARAARARGDDIRLMVSLEMLGAYDDAPGSQRYPPVFGWFYPDRANFVAFVSNLASRHVLRRAVAAFRASTNFPVESLATFEIVPGVGWSDQLSFWREDYRALMVTDTAFYRYAHYHTAQDTPDKIDYRRMAEVVEGLAGALERLANEGESL